jgi:hypothetical protein
MGNNAAGDGADDLRRPLLSDDDGGAGSGADDSLRGDCDALNAFGGGGGGEDDAPCDAGPQLAPLTQVCPFILANEFCERLAYYGLASNLVTYFSGACACAFFARHKKRFLGGRRHRHSTTCNARLPACAAHCG